MRQPVSRGPLRFTVTIAVRWRMPCNARTSHEIKIASADLASICIDRCIDQRSAAVCVRDRMMEKKPLHRCILLIVLLLLTEHKTAHGQEISLQNCCSYKVRENEGSIELCATVTEGIEILQENTTIKLSTINHSATSPKDFISLTNETIVSWQSPDDRHCVNISIKDNTILDDDRFFEVELSSTNSSFTIIYSSANVTILNDDDATFSFSSGSYNVSESDIALLCVKLTNGTLGRSIIIDVNTSNGSALSSHDFSADTDLHSLVFVSGQSSDNFSEQCFSVIIYDDNILEDEETFSVHLTSTLPNVLTVFTTAIITIIDNDFVEVGFSNTSYTAAEEDQGKKICAELTNGTLGKDITVYISGVNGSAMLSMDYAAFQPIVFTSGQSSDDVRGQCVDIVILDDDILENDETVTVQLSSESNSISVVPSGKTATITIVDNDFVEVALTRSLYEVQESSDPLVCVKLSNGSLETTVYVLAITINGTAMSPNDFSGSERQIFVFDSGQSSVNATEQCLNLTIHDDSTLEDDETFQVHLESTLSTVLLNPSQKSAIITILDDDYITVGLETCCACKVKSGSIRLCSSFTKGSLEKDVSVQITTSDGSATSPMDYVSVVSFPLNFTHGESSYARRCVDVSINLEYATFYSVVSNKSVDSVTYEGYKNFELQLMTNSSRVVINPDQRFAVIMDSNIVKFGPQKAAYQVNESEGSIEVCAELKEGVLTDGVTLNARTLRDEAIPPGDYSTLSDKLTFAMNQSSVGNSTTKCLNIYIEKNDTCYENDEHFFFALSLVEERKGVIVCCCSKVTIVDDDYVKISFSQKNYEAVESSGSVELCAKITERCLGTDVDVKISIMSDTALPKLDYKKLKPKENITFHSGQPFDGGISQCKNITLIDDNLYERNQSFTVVLSSYYPSVIIDPQGNSTTVTILDDEELHIDLLNCCDYEIKEDAGSIQICGVITKGTLEVNASIDISTLSETANNMDYSALNFHNLTFISGQSADDESTQCVEIEIYNDDINEGNEYFNVVLTSYFSSVVAVSGMSSGNVRIIDNDVVKLRPHKKSYDVMENSGVVSVCYKITQGVLGRNITLLATTHDRNAISDLDYAVQSKELTFFSGQSTKAGSNIQCLNISILDDNCYEANEDFRVNFKADESEVVLAQRANTVEIEDDDAISIAFVNTTVFVLESAGVIEICAELTSGCLGSDASVPVDVISGTALSSDYRLISELLFYSGQSSNDSSIGCAKVEIINDNSYERAEYFSASLSSSDPSIIIETENSSVNITILDDDDVLISLLDHYEALENNGTIKVCAFIKRGEFEVITTVEVFSSDGNASSPEDYAALVLHPLTFREGQSHKHNNMQCVDIPIVNDELYEGNESFEVEIFTNYSSVIVNKSFAFVIIIDDDAVTFRPKQNSYEVIENLLFVEICYEIFNGLLEANIDLQVHTSNGTAISSNDYDAVVSRVLTFTSDVSTECLNITITDDSCYEVDKEFEVISSTVLSSPLLNVLQHSVTVTIKSNDNITLGFRNTSYKFTESDNFHAVCAEITTGCIESDVVVKFTTVNGTALSPEDYNFQSVDITFYSGQSLIQCTNISLVADDVFERDQYFTAVLTSNSYFVTVNPSHTNITVIDDHVLTFSLEERNMTVLENVGAIEVCIDVIEGTLGTEIFVTVQTLNGTAKDGYDYGGVLRNITFGPFGIRKCFQIHIFNDTIDENQENFVVELSTSQEGISVETALLTVTIAIDLSDVDTVAMAKASYEVLESDGAVKVCAVLTGGILERNEVVSYILSNITAISPGDYTYMSQEITFVSGQSATADNMQCLIINITNDNVYEEDETFSVRLYSTSEVVNIDQKRDTANITIIDTSIAEIQWTSSTYVATENSNVSVCVELNSPIETDITFNINILKESTAAYTDYEFNKTESLTFYSGENLGQTTCVNISILNDNAVESTEILLISLSSELRSIHFKNATTKLEITQDPDDRVLVFMENSSLNVQLTETVQYPICVQRNNTILERSVVVTLSTESVNTISGVDYSPLNAVGLILDNETDKICYNITLYYTPNVEEDKMFKVLLTSVDPAVLLNAMNVTTLTVTQIEPHHDGVSYVIIILILVAIFLLLFFCIVIVLIVLQMRRAAPRDHVESKKTQK